MLEGVYSDVPTRTDGLAIIDKLNVSLYRDMR